MYSGDEYYGDDVTTGEGLDGWDGETYCECCGEPLDIDAAILIDGEMWCEHCAEEAPSIAGRFA